MLTVENILGRGAHDIWNVNVEAEYHEESTNRDRAGGTGRDAPIIPKAASGRSGA